MGDNKRAISVRLGINNGRHSPKREPPQSVLVYGDAKVNWFFLEGAFVLQAAHKRDHTQLEKDFDLYLKRPGSRGDICLNPSREITEYGIKKDDELEFRHKTLPISVNIDLHHGERRQIEVNSGYPVMDVVQAICEQIVIKHSQELSLARDQRNSDETTTQYKWLDPQSSLNVQGIKDGDTLLLRKKHFILNDDVEEAVHGNTLLSALLYHQIRDMFVSDNFVGLTGIDKDKTLAQISCYLHHIEQKEESISDEEMARKVMPRCRLNDDSFPSKLITVYFHERMVTLSAEKARTKLLELFIPSQSIVLSYYPVKVEDDPQAYVLVCHSTAVALCTVEESKLQPVDDREWRYINIRGSSSTNKQKTVSVHALGSRHEFSTQYSFQVARHITESLELTKQKSARNMQKKAEQAQQAAQTPAAPTPVAVAPVVAAPVVVQPPRQLSPEPPSHTVTLVSPVPGPAKPLVVEQGARNMQKKAEQAQQAAQTPAAPTPVAVAPVVAAPVVVQPPRQLSPEPPSHTVTLVSPVPKPAKPLVVEQVVKKPQRPRSQEIVVVDDVTPTPHTPPSVIHIPIPPPPPSLPSITVNDETPNTHSEPLPPPPTIVVNKEEEEKKEPPTPVTALSFSATLHIPEYFGLDFREVLRDYRLFHIIVMDKDKRTLLLNIKKPVREVIASACATFCIHDHQRQKFWLPRGKKNILVKYGGKPKKRAGKFLRKTEPNSISPELGLASNKSLEEQYDFDLKPLILHLHYRDPETAEEDTDHGLFTEEVDMGMEWPLHETSDVRSYRQFYQSWCGAVQGAYPMTKADAIRLAALLTHTYYGDRKLYKSWPPSDYDVKVFLPEMYWKSLGIAGEVDKEYKVLSGKTPQECITEASEFCSKKLTHQGVFYEVSVPGHGHMFHRKKMQTQLFGINSHGVFSINRDNGEVLFTHRFSDIFDWKYGENTFKLNFSSWSTDYNAYTYQREEILDILQLYIEMTHTGIISQAPSRPPSTIMEDSAGDDDTMKRKVNQLALALGSNSPQFSINISVSPESSPGPATPTSPKKSVADGNLETPDSTRDVIMSAV